VCLVVCMSSAVLAGYGPPIKRFRRGKSQKLAQPRVSIMLQVVLWRPGMANRYFRKFDPQFGTEFEDILVSCRVLQLSENSDIHCTTHVEFPPPRAPRRDYYLSPRTTLERANFNIIPPHFVLVFKSSNTPQFIRQCRFARRLARLRIVMSVDLWKVDREGWPVAMQLAPSL
jgi:hypothetical protein